MHASWFCTNRRCRAIPAGTARLLARLATRAGDAGLRRLGCARWVRYSLPLAALPPAPNVALQTIDETFMRRLRRHPEAGEPQLRSAQHLWEAGIARGYAWLDDTGPLGVMWLIPSLDQAGRRRLGVWAGMYPVLPAGVGVTEGLYTFRRALRQRGGAATPLTLAVLHEARKAGLTEIHSHIHVDNIAAHRWAQRLGLHPYGMIHRYRLNVRYLHERYCYLHTLGDIPAALAPSPDAAVRALAGR
jgi:hypothetical protein